MKSYSMGTTNDYISKQPLENSTLAKAGVFFYRGLQDILQLLQKAGLFHGAAAGDDECLLVAFDAGISHGLWDLEIFYGR